MLIGANQLWLDGRLQEGLGVTLSDGTVAEVAPLRGTPDLTVPILMPGCTDLQVNGGGGVMLNTSPTPEGIAAIAEAHRALGTVAIMPTVITDAPEVMAAAADAVIASMGQPGVAGIHIEGPHIAVERKGTHDPRFIRPLGHDTMRVLRHLRDNHVPVILTLAVELADPALLREAAAMGVILSAGHSMATAAEARAAIAEGVSMFTHLYNAMPQMTSRAPGMIAEAILSQAWCGLIADGIHVSPEMLRLTLAARPRADRCFLVSDAMPTVGGPDTFTLYGNEIAVRDGALVNAAGSLAGAHIDMVTSIGRLVAMTGVPVAQAIAMATNIPRAAARLAPLAVAPGMAARDLIALGDDLTLLPLAP